MNLGNFENIKIDVEMEAEIPAGAKASKTVDKIRRDLEKYLSKQYVRIKGEADPVPPSTEGN